MSAPEVPSIEQAYSKHSNSITVEFNEVSGATSYILRAESQTGDFFSETEVRGSPGTVVQLQPYTGYKLSVMSVNKGGRSQPSQPIKAKTGPPTPDVTHIQVTQGRSLGIAVYWVKVQGAETYTALTSNSQNCTTIDISYCSIMPVECGQNHSVSVTAYNSAGPSIPSQPADYITYPCPPENIWVEEPEAGNCSVVWDEVPLVEYYMAFIKRDDGTEKSCNTTGTTCPFFCMCGYTYLTTVFPYNQAGSSPSAHGVSVKLVSTETLEITWSPVKGAELYETTAAQTNDVIHCNDTAPVCALSDLQCNTAYSVVVTPCSELRGCNRTCTPHTHETAPCAPQILNMTQSNNSSYRVLFTTPNTQNTSYTITAIGRYDTHTCNARNGSCELTELPCGSTYDVKAVATTAVGRSLPGYSKPLETGTTV
ncbi:hypothetical protein PAMP_004802 [Pampus punctatissimus]